MLCGTRHVSSCGPLQESIRGGREYSCELKIQAKAGSNDGNIIGTETAGQPALLLAQSAGAKAEPGPVAGGRGSVLVVGAGRERAIGSGLVRSHTRLFKHAGGHRNQKSRVLAVFFQI